MCGGGGDGGVCVWGVCVVVYVCVCGEGVWWLKSMICRQCEVCIAGVHINALCKIIINVITSQHTKGRDTEYIQHMPTYCVHRVVLG